MRYSLKGTVVGQATRTETAFRVQTNWVHNMFKLSKESRPHLKAWTWHLSWILAVVLSLCWNKKVCGCSVQLHLSGIEIVPGFARTAGAARRHKKVVNGMASCFTILKRITRLKYVDSEVGQSAFTLKRVPSSGSMAPCRGHHGRSHTRQEMDH